MSSSHLERRFESYWTSHYPTIAQPMREYMFHPSKNWRFDYAWLNHMVALEIQGGTFVRGRHSRGAALSGEYEKINQASLMGWRIFYADTTMMALNRLPIIAEQLASVVSSPIFMGDLEKSRWIAIVRNLDPKDCFEWHGIEVNRVSATQYCVVKSGKIETFKRGKQTLERVRKTVVDHILGEK